MRQGEILFAKSLENNDSLIQPNYGDNDNDVIVFAHAVGCDRRTVQTKQAQKLKSTSQAHLVHTAGSRKAKVTLRWEARLRPVALHLCI